jgi:hypothetical protein
MARAVRAKHAANAAPKIEVNMLQLMLGDARIVIEVRTRSQWIQKDATPSRSAEQRNKTKRAILKCRRINVMQKRCRERCCTGECQNKSVASEEEELSQSIARAKLDSQPMLSTHEEGTTARLREQEQKSKNCKNEAVVAIFIEIPGAAKSCRLWLTFCAAATLLRTSHAIRPPSPACRS